MSTEVLLNIENPRDPHSSLLYVSRDTSPTLLSRGVEYTVVIGRGVRGGWIMRFSRYPGRWFR